MRKQPLHERFWSKVQKGDSCWTWTASLSTHGYGQIGLNGGVQRAHRVSWFLTYGAFPDQKVCHHCDNPVCVRPDHLFLGTQTDNLADMRAKGRGALPPTIRGEGNNKARLTTVDVTTIRQRHANGESFGALGREYGVWKTTISAIVHRRTWAHLQ